MLARSCHQMQHTDREVWEDKEDRGNITTSVSKPIFSMQLKSSPNSIIFSDKSACQLQSQSETEIDCMIARDVCAATAQVVVGQMIAKAQSHARGRRCSGKQIVEHVEISLSFALAHNAGISTYTTKVTNRDFSRR